MLGILRDWILDPAALLFFLSVLVGGVLIASYALRLRRQTALLGGREAEVASTRKKGAFSVRAIFLIGIWFAAFELFSAPIFVNPMVRLLERIYETDQQCVSGSHVVLLSGGVDSRAVSINSFERMTPASFVRATEASRIITNEPNVKLIVSGGVLYRVPEADVIGQYLMTLGVPKANLMLESGSRNTYENAVNVAALLVNEEVTGPVRLLSSAMHMHRAFKSFEKALEGTGISVCAVSVDYQGIPRLLPYGWVPQVTALLKFDHLLHELIALLVYKLKGWI